MTNIVPNPEGSENAWTAFSHSGNERNRLFLNQAGQGFVNASGLSGADSLKDGRAFALLDFNRDGFSDLILVNANEPLIQVFQNQTPASNQRNFLAVRLQGAEPSNFDAIGARVFLKTEHGVIFRALSAGEGFASQNSKTLLIGLGKSEEVEELTVIWPSGRQSHFYKIPTGKLVELTEGVDEAKIGRY